MKIDIKGRRRFNYSAEKIYELILDLPSIVMEFPIIKKVEQPTEDEFIFTFDVNFQLYSGTYYATVLIEEKRENQFLKLKGTHKSRAARINIDLETLVKEVEESVNEVAISGQFIVGGMMKYAGGAILKNGVSMGVDMMFDFLQRKLDKGAKDELSDLA